MSSSVEQTAGEHETIASEGEDDGLDAAPPAAAVAGSGSADDTPPPSRTFDLHLTEDGWRERLLVNARAELAVLRAVIAKRDADDAFFKEVHSAMTCRIRILSLIYDE